VARRDVEVRRITDAVVKSPALGLVMIAFWISACSQRAGAPDEDAQEASLASSSFYSSGEVSSSDEPASADEEVPAPFDEDAAQDLAEEQVSGESYVAIGQPYGCTEDCSGHEAGFRYRAENGYSGYSADSPSFNEGGQAFDEAVKERVDEMRSDYESGGEAPY